MRNILSIIYVVFTLLFGSSCAGKALPLAKDGRSVYSIFLTEQSSLQSAKIIQYYFKEVTGVMLPIREFEKGAKLNNGIVVGKYGDMPPNAKIPALAKEETLVKVVKNNIFVTSSTDLGLLYASYTFVEEVLGCRYFFVGGKYVPNKAVLTINDKKLIRERPVFDHRQYWYFGSFVPDQEFLTWHRLQNYKTDKEWGMYMVHNLNNFVPDDLINKSPEFFALVNGKRVVDQLNFTNNSMRSHLIDQVRKYFMQNPTISTLALNPKDNENYCECSECQAVYAAEESKMGALLSVVNDVAQQFPEKRFVVQAFKSNRRPPKNLKPLSNVNIVLSGIELTRLDNIASSKNPRTKPYLADLASWSEKSNHLLIWDYLTWYENSLIPFPNFDNMATNARFYAKRDVDGIFWEGDGGLPSFQYRLRAYLGAKLLWDPEADIAYHTKQFCDFYYQEASPKMLSYLSELEKRKNGVSGFIETGNQNFYNDAANSYLSVDALQAYRRILEEAKVLVKTKADIVDRIELDEIGLLLFELERDKRSGVISAKDIDLAERLLKKHKIEKYNYYLQSTNNYINQLREK